MFGADEITISEPLLPARIWTPLIGSPGRPQPANSWEAVAYNATSIADEAYASLARNLSMSLREAGIRLRDASDEYHRQLRAALARAQPVGRRFSNIPLSDLRLAFHSLLAAMGSARDYLAGIAGLHAGAPANVNGMARLIDWADKGANAAARSDPLLAAILAAWRPADGDRWLFDIGEYRNLFLHREPLGATDAARWMTLVERGTVHGPIRELQLLVPSSAGASTSIDALKRFVELSTRLCTFCNQALSHARYSDAPPHVTIVSSEN